MNETAPAQESMAPISRDEILSGLFAHLVMQQTNLALLLLGRVPHPETGKTERDLDGAQVFIEQLEMIEVKTKGNLNPTEEKLLKQSLTTVRMAFVEAVNQDPHGEPTATTDTVGSGSKPEASGAAPSPSPDPAAERRTKFSKSY